MANISSPVTLLQVSPLDAKSCNWYVSGADVVIETIPQYLARVTINRRYPAGLVAILLPKEGYTPSPSYPYADFKDILTNFDCKFYHFKDGLYDANFVEFEVAASVLVSDATPVDTDEVVSLRSTSWLKTTWTVLKAFLKTYFDGIYSAIGHTHTFNDEKVKYAADDAAAGYLSTKIVAGTNITVEEGTGDDADKLKISASGGATDEKVKYDAADPTAGYLADKIIAGSGITITEGIGAEENKLKISSLAGDFATKALDNLASVAINTSLISATDSTDDLGSSSKYWANLYVNTIYTPVINGGAYANDDITIQGTTNATRNVSYLNLQPNGGLIGIGTSSPILKLDMPIHERYNNLCRFGTFEFYSGGTNYGAIYDNAWYNGGSTFYRNDGYSLAWNFFYGVFELLRADSGLAGNVISYVSLFKIGTGGTNDHLVLGKNTAARCILDVGAHNVTNSSVIVGGFEVQSYDVNDIILSNNLYYNAAWKYRANGYGVAIEIVTGDINFHTSGSGTAGNTATVTTRLIIKNTGNVGIGVTAPTAVLHLKAGTATANTAPLKFTSGTLLSAPAAGAVEFLTDDYYVTITTGAARKGIILNDGSNLTSGKIPIASTNGRLIDGQTPLSGTKVYYVADSSGGAVTRKLTFINGILVSET